MTRQQLVAHLSGLPQKELEEIRLMAANDLYTGPTPIKTCERWIENCNEALEAKEFNRLRGYDIQDTEFTFV